jgi:hypothetical protein
MAPPSPTIEDDFEEPILIEFGMLWIWKYQFPNDMLGESLKDFKVANGLVFNRNDTRLLPYTFVISGVKMELKHLYVSQMVVQYSIKNFEKVREIHRSGGFCFGGEIVYDPDVMDDEHRPKVTSLTITSLYYRRNSDVTRIGIIPLGILSDE